MFNFLARRSAILVLFSSFFILLIGGGIFSVCFLFDLSTERTSAWDITLSLLYTISTVFIVVLGIMAYNRLSLEVDVLKEQMRVVILLFVKLGDLNFLLRPNGAGSFYVMRAISPKPEQPTNHESFLLKEIEPRIGSMPLLFHVDVQMELLQLGDLSENPFMPTEIAEPLRKIVPTVRVIPEAMPTDKMCMASEEDWLEVVFPGMEKRAIESTELVLFEDEKLLLSEFKGRLKDVIEKSGEWLENKAPTSIKLNIPFYYQSKNCN